LTFQNDLIFVCVTQMCYLCVIIYFLCWGLGLCFITLWILLQSSHFETVVHAPKFLESPDFIDFKIQFLYIRLSFLFVCFLANRARSRSTNNTGSPSSECDRSSTSQWTREESTQETPCLKYPIPISRSRSPGNVWGKLCPQYVFLLVTCKAWLEWITMPLHWEIILLCLVIYLMGSQPAGHMLYTSAFCASHLHFL
jgi:hypothetical protein